MVLRTWYERYGEASKTLKDVKDDIENHMVKELDDGDKWTGRWTIDPAWDDIRAALISLDRQGKTLDLTAVRYAFRGWVGRVLGDLQLQKAGQDRLGVIQWRVKKLSI